MAGSVIVTGARTPIGKLSGGLAPFSAQQLGGFVIKAALERAGLSPDEVDYVFMGQVLGAGQGQITARQAAVNGGVPMTVPATTVNKVCLSGLNTIYLADQMIQAGEADIVIAGGMESMTNAPHILPGSRAGFRYGDATLQDAIVRDGLWCAFDACLMGAGTEKYSASRNISRERQDELAAKSHERAAAAIKDGRFADEIVPVEIPQRKGDPLVFDTDEGVRPGTSAESLGALKPAFDSAGNITAGNASQLSDGASAVVVASKSAAERLAVSPLGEVVGYGQVAGPDPSLLSQPSRAIQAALERVARCSGTSICSRSTKRSPPWASPRWTTSASPTRSSMSTVAPSRSAIRSACRATDSRSPCSASCADAGVVSAPRPCAAAVDRATRCSSARSRPQLPASRFANASPMTRYPRGSAGVGL